MEGIYIPRKNCRKMENLSLAKDKAEKFLLGIIEATNRKIINYRKPEDPREYFENWPLRFEAYSYIGHKYKQKDLVHDIKELWRRWIYLSHKNELGFNKIFWPFRCQHEVHADFEWGEEVIYFPSPAFEKHVSMFRVKEMLKIGGYSLNFEEGVYELINILFTGLPSFKKYGTEDNYNWQIVRCPSLRNKLNLFIRYIASDIHRNVFFRNLFSLDGNEENCPNSEYSPLYHQASCSFFLFFSYLKEEYLDLAKKAAEILINKQDIKGTFDNDVLVTCLCASLIHATNADPSESVINRALEYVLSKQNKKGYWDFMYENEDEQGCSTGWRAFSTVIALETIDLITNDRNLPIWVDRTKLPGKYQGYTDPRIPPPKPLEIPEGTTWKEIAIRFISNEAVQITAGTSHLGVKNFAELGFKNEKNQMPTHQWETLRTLAIAKGELTREDGALNNEEISILIKRISILRNKLKALFDLSDNPFFPFKKSNSYKTKFNISLREESDDDELLIANDEIIEDFMSDIRKKESRAQKQIKIERIEEVKRKNKDTE